MMWQAIGAMTLFGAALVMSHWGWGRMRYRDGRESVRLEMAERRAKQRAEARTAVARGRHALDPFPDEAEFERLLPPEELAAMAETGELRRLKDETAAFFRVLSLREWARKRESAA